MRGCSGRLDSVGQWSRPRWANGLAFTCGRAPYRAAVTVPRLFGRTLLSRRQLLSAVQSAERAAHVPSRRVPPFARSRA